MRKKDVTVNAIVYFVFVMLACFFAAIFSSMLVKFINDFVELEFIFVAGFKAFFLLGVTLFFVALFSYKSGYRTAYFDGIETVCASLIATVVHFIVTLIFGFFEWISGATVYISGFVAHGDNYIMESQTKVIPMITLIGVGFVLALMYSGVIILSTYAGKKKRLADRAAIMQ